MVINVDDMNKKKFEEKRLIFSLVSKRKECDDKKFVCEINMMVVLNSIQNHMMKFYFKFIFQLFHIKNIMN